MLNKKCQESKDLSFDIKKKRLTPKFRDLIRLKIFKKKLFDYQYFVINYRSKIISPDDLAIIISLSGSQLRNC